MPEMECPLNVCYCNIYLQLDIIKKKKNLVSYTLIAYRNRIVEHYFNIKNVNVDRKSLM